MTSRQGKKISKSFFYGVYFATINNNITNFLNQQRNDTLTILCNFATICPKLYSFIAFYIVFCSFLMMMGHYRGRKCAKNIERNP